MIRDYGGFPILAGQTNENTDQYRPRATEYFSQFQWLRINVIGLGLNHIRNDQTVTARPICRHGRFKSCNLFGQLGNYLFQFPTLKKGGWAEGQLGWGGVGGGGGAALSTTGDCLARRVLLQPKTWMGLFFFFFSSATNSYQCVQYFRVSKRWYDCSYDNTIARQEIRNSWGLKILDSKTEQSKNSFFVRTVADWNKLEDTVVTADSVTTFSSAAGRALQGAAPHT